MKKLIALITALLVIPISPVAALETRTIDVVALTWPGATAPAVTVNDVANAIKSEVATRWNYLAQKACRQHFCLMVALLFLKSLMAQNAHIKLFCKMHLQRWVHNLMLNILKFSVAEKLSAN